MLAFADGTLVSLGEQSSLTISHYDTVGGDDAAGRLDLALVQGTFRIISGAIANHEGGQFTVSTDSAKVLMDGHGADVIVRAGLTQVGSPMPDPHLLVSTPQGETLIQTQGGILDILPDGRASDVRGYTDFETAYLRASAPLADEASNGADRAHDADDASTATDADPSPDRAQADDAPHDNASVDGQDLLTLFTAYFGVDGLPQDLHGQLFQQAQGETAADQDDLSLSATARLLDALDELATGDSSQALRDFFADNGEDLISLVNNWMDSASGHAEEPTESAPDLDQATATAQLDAEPHDQATEELIVQNSQDEGTLLAPDSSDLQAEDSQDNDVVLSPVLNASPDSSYKLQFASPAHSVQTVLQGGANDDDLGTDDSSDASQDSVSPTLAYDSWDATAEASETQTTDTAIAVPHYSLQIEYCTVRVGWFSIKVPVPVIKVEYSQQIISSETTTTTSYADGATEVQTMIDSDADGHWNQSQSILTYDDGAQRTVTLYDSDDDGTWDSYETTLVYNDGQVASQISGNYAEASGDVLAHLALAEDDPSVA